MLAIEGIFYTAHCIIKADSLESYFSIILFLISPGYDLKAVATEVCPNSRE